MRTSSFRPTVRLVPVAIAGVMALGSSATAEETRRRTRSRPPERLPRRGSRPSMSRASTLRRRRARTSTSTPTATGSRKTRSPPTGRAGAPSTSCGSATRRTSGRSSTGSRRTSRPRRDPTSRSSATSTASCMDEAAIEAQGLAPVEPVLARIEAIHDLPSLRAEIGRLQSMGVNALFAFGSEEDRKDSTTVIAAALQGGLGLPERDYYLKTDEKSVKLREQYVAHVAKMLELAGAAPAKAAADAKTILAFETKLAQASMNNVDFRDPDKTYHPMTVAAFSQATPNLAWATYFEDQKIPAVDDAQRLAAGVLQGRERAGQVRAPRDLEDLSALAVPVGRGADAPQEVRGRELRLLRQDALRHSRDPAALEALRDRDGQRARDGARKDLRPGVFPAGGEEAGRRAREEPAPRAERRHPDARLDE